MIGCPLQCTFCPQDELKAAYGKAAGRRFRGTGTMAAADARTHGPLKNKYLSLDNFQIILKKIPRHVRIDFAGMAEPWANTQATQMLKYTLEKGYQTGIYTTLFEMSRDDANRTLDLLHQHLEQLEILCLHVPDANGNMTGWRPSTEYRDVLALFLDFGQRELKGKFTLAGSLLCPRFQVMTMDPSGRVHEALTDFGLNLDPWRGHSRAGTLREEVVEKLQAKPPPQHRGAVMCSITPFFDHNVLLPNGDVVLYCMDYSLKHIIGNLLEQDYYEIFVSPELARLRTENSKPGFSKCSLCKSCDDAVEYNLIGNSWQARSESFWDMPSRTDDRGKI